MSAAIAVSVRTSFVVGLADAISGVADGGRLSARMAVAWIAKPDAAKIRKRLNIEITPK
jgi:hypothetical protein